MWNAIALVEISSTLWFVGHEGKILIVLLRWRPAHAEYLRTTLATRRLLRVLHSWATG